MSGQTFEENVRQEICFILDQHEGYQPLALEDDLVSWVVNVFGGSEIVEPWHGKAGGSIR